MMRLKSNLADPFRATLAIGLGCALFGFSGCGANGDRASDSDRNATKHAEHDESDHEGHDHAGHGHDHDGHAHHHAGGESIFWQREDVPVGDYELKLGHHGAHLHAGDEFEPAVSIERDGKAISDAAVRVALVPVASGGDTAFQVLKFEEAHADEPAHYAQARLRAPRNATSVTLRFEVRLPGAAEAEVIEVPVPLAKD